LSRFDCRLHRDLGTDTATADLLPLGGLAGTLQGMTEMLEQALRRVSALPLDEQDAIASQIIETLQDETAWKEKLARSSDKLRRLAEDARRENRRGETRSLDELV
jgi:hypothetical protein